MKGIVHAIAFDVASSKFRFLIDSLVLALSASFKKPIIFIDETLN